MRNINSRMIDSISFASFGFGNVVALVAGASLPLPKRLTWHCVSGMTGRGMTRRPELVARYCSQRFDSPYQSSQISS